MFPYVPEDRSGLTSLQIKALAVRVRADGRAALAEGEVAKAKEARTLSEALEAEAAEASSTETLEDDLAEPEVVEPDPEPEVASDDTPDDPEPDEPEDPVEPAEPEVEASNLPVAAPPSGLSTGAEPGGVGVLESTLLLAHDGVAGVPRGTPFEDWAQMAQGLVQRSKEIAPSSAEKHYVAFAPSRYPEDRKLTNDPVHNLRILQNIGFAQDELTAALCAPLTPYYGMSCENTLRRPVAASLPGFEAPRGGVSIMSSPSLTDVSEGGIWTHEDDDDEEATKACDEIVCGTPEDFVMYAVWWCLTVKNWHLLTFPELVEAFLNRGLARRARIAETQLLEGLASGVSTVTVPALGYGSTVSITTQVLTYLSLYREQQRWDNEPFVGWAHRWVLDAMRVDQSRRRRDGMIEFATEADINRLFADVGVDMTWSLDEASWMTPVPDIGTGANPSVGSAGTLNDFPDTAEILLAPRGKFAMIDRGQLSIGVTGNNYYRDTAMLEKNTVRFFVENYEGVVDTTSCPAHLLEFSGLCHNGVQIDDVAIDCDGTAAA